MNSNTTPTGYVSARVTFDFDEGLPSLPAFVRRQGHGIVWGATHWNGAEMPLFRLSDLVSHRAELSRLFPEDWDESVRVVWDGDRVSVLSPYFEGDDMILEEVAEYSEDDGETFVEIGSAAFTWAIARDASDDDDE